MYKEIIEGRTRLLVPEKGTFGRTVAGRIKRAPVFYNPRMKLNRDICCSVVRALKRDVVFLDLLSGSGAKGIRVAHETGQSVHLNDASEDAVALIEKNARLNGLDNVTVSNENANLLLQKRYGSFDFIDIDPFGTPVQFLDNSLMAVDKHGVLGITATDTAPLCGVYPAACFRKYGARPLRSEFCHEVGLRLLVGYAARTAAKYSYGIRCLLSHSTEHYFRVYLKVFKGKKKADASLEELGYVYYCRKCLEHEYGRGYLPELRSCGCDGRYEVAGPLWLGRIQDAAFCKGVVRMSWYLTDPGTERLLEMISEEIDIPFYYDIHRVCRILRTSAIPTDEVIRALEDEGYRATRTHFSKTGIKTDAPGEVVKGVLLMTLSFLISHLAIMITTLQAVRRIHLPIL